MLAHLKLTKRPTGLAGLTVNWFAGLAVNATLYSRCRLCTEPSLHRAECERNPVIAVLTVSGTLCYALLVNGTLTGRTVNGTFASQG